MTSQNAVYATFIAFVALMSAAAFITCRSDFTINQTAVWLVFSARLFMAVGLTVATV